MKMKKYIELPTKDREFIMNAFKVSAMAVSRALSYVNDTDLSLRIRKIAMQRGGIMMVRTPIQDTWHDNDGFMRQFLPNGVQIEGDKTTGYVAILKGGTEIAGFNNPSLTELENIQAQALRL